MICWAAQSLPRTIGVNWVEWRWESQELRVTHGYMLSSRPVWAIQDRVPKPKPAWYHDAVC